MSDVPIGFPFRLFAYLYLMFLYLKFRVAHDRTSRKVWNECQEERAKYPLMKITL